MENEQFDNEIRRAHTTLVGRILDCLNKNVEFVPQNAIEQDAWNTLVSQMQTDIGDHVINGTESPTISMVYQPIAVGETPQEKSVTKKSEALFRYTTHGVNINPEVAFYIAKRTPLNNGTMTLEEGLVRRQLAMVAQDVAKLKEKFGDEYSASFNLSPELMTGEFAEYYSTILAQNGLNNANIAIELVETGDYSKVDRTALETLRANGTKVYLDDCFSRKAELDTAVEFNPDVIKIDQGVLSALMDTSDEIREQAVRQIKATIAYVEDAKAAGHNVDIVCEGIRDDVYSVDRIASVLYAYPQIQLQGYEVSKPLSADDLIENAESILQPRFDSTMGQVKTTMDEMQRAQQVAEQEKIAQIERNNNFIKAMNHTPEVKYPPVEETVTSETSSKADITEEDFLNDLTPEERAMLKMAKAEEEATIAAQQAEALAQQQYEQYGVPPTDFNDEYEKPLAPENALYSPLEEYGKQLAPENMPSAPTNEDSDTLVDVPPIS